MATIDNDHNHPGLKRKIAECKARQKPGRYVRVDRMTSIFVEEGKDIAQAIQKFKLNHNIK